MAARDLTRILRNWKDECDTPALYDALAHIERNPRLRAACNNCLSEPRR